MRVTNPYRINTLPERKKLPDTPAAKLVLQCEFGMASAAEETKLVKTGASSTCVRLVLFSPSTKTGGLAHFDLKTEVNPSFRAVIMPELLRRGCQKFQARLIGGLAGQSGKLVRNLMNAVKGRGIKLIGVDLYEPHGYPGLILDTENGELFDLQSPLLPFEAEEIRRNEEALLYLVANQKQRMIRLVGSI